MKKSVLILSLVFACSIIFAQNKNEVSKETKKETQISTCTLNVEMECANCEAKVKKQLAFTKGVKDVETNLEKQTATVKYQNDKTTPDKLVAAVKELGYSASVETKSCCQHKKDDCCHGQAKKASCCQEKKESKKE